MTTTPTKQDLVKGRATAALWQVPWAVILLASFLDPIIQTPVWTVGFTIMGVACLANARGCGRLHCFLTGPLYLLGAGASVLRGFDAISIESRWVLYAMIIGTVLAYVPEWVRGQYVEPTPCSGGSK
ncbi:MAG: hypothetical protein ACE5D3_01630 [Candidatus Binatia bacterium]